MKQEPSIGNLFGLVQARVTIRKEPADIVNEAVESFTAAVAKLSSAQGEIQKQVDEDEARVTIRKEPADIVNEAVESFTAAVAKLSSAQGEIQKQVDEDEARINELMKDVEVANIELSRLERIRNRIADLVS